MASFAPVYRPPTYQQSFLTREQKREHKRKRRADDECASDENSDNEEELPELDADALRIPHPVNKKDPYYVAGWPREKPSPGRNFPHAAVPNARRDNSGAIEKGLANLSQPLYAPKSTLDEFSGSSRRRHLDNLTALLHKCMLNGDWTRASRIWGLILRTEVGGYGPDIRQNGRWMVGAELLMRRSKGAGPDSTNVQPHVEAHITDESFKVARAYYERLVLQYPHLQRTHHSTVSAKVIYPALFNIWIFEVQHRSESARNAFAVTPDMSEMAETLSVASGSSERIRTIRVIRERELAEALPVAQRLDDLLVSPPYDTHAELLELRGMIGLWLFDLHQTISGRNLEGEDESMIDEDNIRLYSLADKAHVESANAERRIARKMFRKMADSDMPLQPENLAFLRDADDGD